MRILISRVIATLLTITMVVTAVPMTAFASGLSENDSEVLMGQEEVLSDLENVESEEIENDVLEEESQEPVSEISETESEDVLEEELPETSEEVLEEITDTGEGTVEEPSENVLRTLEPMETIENGDENGKTYTNGSESIILPDTFYAYQNEDGEWCFPVYFLCKSTGTDSASSYSSYYVSIDDEEYECCNNVSYRSSGKTGNVFGSNELSITEGTHEVSVKIGDTVIAEDVEVLWTKTGKNVAVNKQKTYLLSAENPQATSIYDTIYVYGTRISEIYVADNDGNIYAEASMYDFEEDSYMEEYRYELLGSFNNSDMCGCGKQEYSIYDWEVNSLPVSSYNLVVIDVEGKETVIEDVIKTTSSPIINSIIYDSYDKDYNYYDDEFYVELSCVALNPEKVRFYGGLTADSTDKIPILDYQITNRGKIKYKLSKGSYDFSDPLNTKLYVNVEGIEGYEIEVLSSTLTVNMTGFKSIFAVYYNYEKEQLQFGLSANRFRDGDNVSIKVFNDDNDEVASATTVVNNGMVETKLKKGNQYVKLPMGEYKLEITITSSNSENPDVVLSETIIVNRFKGSSSSDWIMSSSDLKDINLNSSKDIVETFLYSKAIEKDGIKLEMVLTDADGSEIQRQTVTGKTYSGTLSYYKGYKEYSLKIDRSKITKKGQYFLSLMSVSDYYSYSEKSVSIFAYDCLVIAKRTRVSLRNYQYSDGIQKELEVSFALPSEESFEWEDIEVQFFDLQGNRIMDVDPKYYSAIAGDLRELSFNYAYNEDMLEQFYVKISYDGQGPKKLDGVTAYYTSYGCSEEFGEKVRVSSSSSSNGVYMGSNQQSVSYICFYGSSLPATLKLTKTGDFTETVHEWKITEADCYKEYSSMYYYFTSEMLSELEDPKAVYNFYVVSDNGQYATCELGKNITVSKELVKPTAVSLMLNNTKVTTANLPLSNETFTLKPKYTPEKSNTLLGLTWTSSNPAVATVENGVITTLSEGTAKITAKTEGGKSATVTIKVGKYLQKIDLMLNGENADVNVLDYAASMDQTFDLQMKAKDYQGNDVENADVVWASSNPKLISVTNTGKITIRKPGRVVITAASKTVPTACVKAIGKIIIEAQDYAPTLENPTIVLNKYSTNKEVLQLVFKYNTRMTSYALYDLDGNLLDEFDCLSEYPAIGIKEEKMKEYTKTSTRKMYLGVDLVTEDHIVPDNPEEDLPDVSYYIPIKITVDVKAPVATWKAIQQPNLFYSSNSGDDRNTAQFMNTGKRIESITEGSDETNYKAIFDKDSQCLTLKPDGLNADSLNSFKADKSVSLKIKFEDSREALTTIAISPKVVKEKVSTSDYCYYAGDTLAAIVDNQPVIDSKGNAFVLSEDCTITLPTKANACTGITYADSKLCYSWDFGSPAIYKDASITAKITDCKYTQDVEVTHKFKYYKEKAIPTVKMDQKSLILNSKGFSTENDALDRASLNLSLGQVSQVPISRIEIVPSAGWTKNCIVGDSQGSIAFLDYNIISDNCVQFELNKALNNDEYTYTDKKGKNVAFKNGTYKVDIICYVAAEKLNRTGDDIALKKLTLPITITDKAPNISLSQKGSINTVDRKNTWITATAKYTNITSRQNLKSVSITKIESKYDKRELNAEEYPFDAVIANNQLLIISKPDKRLATQQYTITMDITTRYPNNNDDNLHKYESVVLKITPKQTITKLTTNTKSVDLYMNSAVNLEKVFKVTSGTNGNSEISDVKLTGFSGGGYKVNSSYANQYFVYNDTFGTLQINHDKYGEYLRIGTTYTLTFEVSIKDQAINTLNKKMVVNVKARIVE